MSAQGPDELRAVHAARRELGPDYDDALLDSFVDRAEAQLRRRLDDDRPVAQRDLASQRQPVRVTLGPGGLTLVLVNGAWGVLSSLILSAAYYGYHARLLFVWMVIAIADAGYLGARIAGRANVVRTGRTAPVDPTARTAPLRQRSGRSTTS